MNIKRIVTFIFLFFIASFTNINTKNKIEELSRIQKELKLAKQKNEDLQFALEKTEEWTSFKQAENNCSQRNNCNGCETYHKTLDALFATEDGKNSAYWQMKTLGLGKMIEYSQEQKSIHAAIYAALRGLYIPNNDIRKLQQKVEQELLELANDIDSKKQSKHHHKIEATLLLLQ